MSQRLFKNATKAFAVGALLASTSLVPHVASANVVAQTDAAYDLNLQAPFGDDFVAAYGKRVTFTYDSATADDNNIDHMRLYAFLYQDGTYVGYVRSATAVAGADAAGVISESVTLPTSALAYNQATFAWVFAGLEGDETMAADDTVDAAAANVTVLKITPDSSGRAPGNSTGIAPATVAAYTTTSSITGAQIAAIGADSDVAANPTSVVSTYNGPALQSVGSSAVLNGTDIKMTFDTSLAAIADNNAVANSSGQLEVNGPTLSGNGVLAKGAVTAGAKIARFDDNSGAFSGQMTSVDLNFIDASTCASTAGLLRDEAGNCAATTSAFAITAFAQPNFAGNSADVMITGGTAVTGNTKINAFYSEAGTTLNGLTAIIRVNLSEALDANGLGNNDKDDLTISPAAFNALIPAAPGANLGANTDTFNLTATGTAATQFIRVNPTSGKVEFSSDSGTTWEAVTIGLAVDAGDAITTAESIDLSAAVTAENVYGAVVSTPTVTTRDDNSNGVLDGITVEFNQSLTTPFAATTGASLVDRDTTSTTVASTTSPVTGDASKLKVVANAESGITGLLTGSETSAANLNTGATNATPIPYDFALSGSQITYSQVYVPATGELKTLADIATGGAITDGASPIATSASFSRAGTATATSGTLTIQGSEGLVNNTIAIQAFQSNSAALPLVNLNEGLAAPSFGAISTTTIANDTFTLTGVSSTVIGTTLTIGSGANIEDAGGNDIVTSSSGVTISEGSVAYTAPSIDSAVVARSTATGNFDSIIVRYTAGVALDSAKSPSPLYTLDVDPATGANFDLLIQSSDATFSASDPTLVILSIPSPGLPSNLSSNAIDGVQIDFNAGTADNAIVSSDDSDVTVATQLNVDVQLPINSFGLYTRDIKGRALVSTAVPANGSYVRADLVRLDSSLVVESKTNLTVPAACGCNGSTLVGVAEVVDSSALVTLRQEALDFGQTSFTAYLGVTKTRDADNTEIGAAAANTDKGDSTGQRIYVASTPTALTNQVGDGVDIRAITVNTTSGAISASGVSGSLTFTSTQTLDILDTGYALLDSEGDFRVSVGHSASSNVGKTLFVMVSLIQPNADAVLLTSASPYFANYLPFVSNVTSSSTVADVGTVDAVTNIETIPVPSVAGWQLLGLTGNTWNKSTTSTTLNLQRLFITVDSSGRPSTLLLADDELNDGDDFDQAFTLRGNTTKTYTEVTARNVVNNVTMLSSGDGLALNNEDGDYATIDGGAETVAAINIFVPVTTTAVSRTVAANWSLITAQAETAVSALPSYIDAVIKVGSNRQAQTWFRDESDNTLTTLEAGAAYFMFFDSAQSAFTFLP